MTLPMPPLANRVPLGRRSTLLLDYRAEDLSLLARSGQLLSVARAGTGMLVADNGVGVAGYQQPRFSRVDTDGDGIVDTMALLIEPAATNLALRSRDLTNASWTKSSLTTALTATGADLNVNSATLCTATGANATALQSVTSGSAQRVTSAYVRRVTGTGTVQMTQDNGSTWTTIAVTAAWQRFSVPNQTIANPVLGFRVVTNGDAIAVDLVQHELGAYPTSPIITTAASAGRLVETLTQTATWPFQNDLTIYAKVAPAWSALSGGVGVDAYALTLGNAAARLQLFRAGAAGNWTGYIDTTGTDASASAAAPVTPLQEVCVQFAGLGNGGTVKIDVGAGFGAASAAASPFTALASSGIYVGGYSSAGSELGGGLIGLKIAAGLFTLKQMQSAR